MEPEKKGDDLRPLLKEVGQHVKAIGESLDDLSKAIDAKARPAGASPGLWARFKGWWTWKRATTIVVGVATVWAIPLLSRQIQDRASARDLKAGLAEDMSSAFGDIESVALLRAYDLDQRLQSSGALTFTPAGALTKPPQRLILARSELNKTYAKWTQATGSIRARLLAYFDAQPDIVQAWSAFAAAFNDLFFVTQNTRDPRSVGVSVRNLEGDVKLFNAWADRVSHSRHVTLDSKDISTLERGQTSRDSIAGFYASYAGVATEFDFAEDNLIKHMFKLHVAGTSTRLCDFWSTFFDQEPGTFCG